ncbi:MAG: protein kinase [Cyanobacteria bacterium P01_F01_bin.13]
MKDEPCNGKGRYDRVESLGKGRSGQTYLARATASNFSPELVVIKQIYQPQEPLEALIQRLRAVGKHPQLPALVVGWQTSEGQFLAFEYISYPRLTQTEPPPWSPGQVKLWLLSLLRVLEHLHSFRLIHGDIRPANIRQDSVHRPSILVDLRITQRLAKQKVALSVSGGDAAYGAPEQALGKLTYASDLYSLGLVAIHLMTGLSPFDLYSVADNRWIWLDLIAEPLPKNLDTVLQKLLERSLENRYTSAAQAIRDLKKTSVLSLLDKARTLLPSPASLSIPLQSLTPKTFSPSSAPSALPASSALSVHWQPLYQFTTNSIATALTLQGKKLAVGTNTGDVFVCDLAIDDELYALGSGRDRIHALAFHPQHPSLYSASSDGTVTLWDLLSGQRGPALRQPQPTDLAIAPPYLIVSDGTGHITLWDLETLTQRHCFNQHQDWVAGIATNGHRLASISRDRTLRLWSLEELRLLETIPIRQCSALALHPGGHHVIIGNDQGQVDVWHGDNPTALDRLCTLEDGVTALALSPDARLLAVGTDGNLLRVYRGSSGQCVSELTQGWGVVAIAFDGYTLVSSSQDETITVWQRQP